MGFRLPGIRKTPKAVDSPKGYLVVYVREKIKQVVIPSSEEFGYDHHKGGLTIPCSDDVFQHITSCLN
ncbi:hypothetical protein AAZX31_U034500 [Glycine max]|uniref:Auxin-induced protein n=1 Tax=Glycine max TaxID=3847 RepID=A0A0R0HSD0_SOYBN|nr:hypothetical protein GYH30_027798 [Glycine max]KRH33486.1 hypothetical protein GLYMA_10G125900v4 [Glycine max]